MDLFIWSGACSFIANTLIGLFVYTRNPRRPENTLFALFSIAVSGWSVGSTTANIIKNQELALTFVRGHYFFGIWLSPLYLHFIRTLTKSKDRFGRIASQAGLFFSGLLTLALFSPQFIKGLRLIPGTSFRISNPGPIYYAFFLFFAIYMGLVIRELFISLRSNIGISLFQFKCLILANCIAIFAGFEYFSRVFGLFDTPPFDDFILVLYVFVLAFAITRYYLFDLETLTEALHRERLATIGLISASINHEIRNPLFIAKGLLQSHLELHKDRLDPETETALQKSVRQIDRVFDMMQRLKKFTQASTKSISEPGTSQACIKTALEIALEMLLLELSSKKITIEQQIADGLPPVEIDQKELEGAFFNLMLNACQAMPDGGCLGITTQTLKNQIVVEIKDTGQGIERNRQKRIFEPFVSSKGEKGTGLGLYITRQLIENHGGSIRVESTPGLGTTFKLSLKIYSSLPHNGKTTRNESRAIN
ncbi:MAG: hypothetical protein H6757_06680 [Candidatus Omnitrophica bacterium]|nr:hypothetical protein [Candidatus Omnitrophota bacterium]